MSALLALTAAIAVCPTNGPRYTCVVDGDSIWAEGEKIRLASIDTPELHGAKCPQEALQAAEARDRLVELLRPGFTIQRAGKDRYRRTLARLTANGRDVGEVLLAEGLARKYDGKRRGWC